MKSTFLYFVLSICLLAHTDTRAQSWLWAQRQPGSECTQPQRVATDAAGNVIVCGGSYFAKYSPAGVLLWKKDATNGFSAQAMNVCTDALGNICVTGTYSATTTFDTETLTTAGFEDVFLAKYDASGNLAWAKGTGGINHDISYTVAADADGNLLIAGGFASPDITFGTTTLSGVGTNMFLVKYSSSGSVVWARRVSNDGSMSTYCLANAITVDNGGNILVTGGFSGHSVTIGATTMANTIYPYGDVFVAKYNASGSVLWAKRAGGDYYDASCGITVDGAGNSYVAGNFTGDSMLVGSQTFYNTSSDAKDGFVASFDASGAFRWAKQIGGTGTDDVLAAAADNAGNLYIAFVFNSPTLPFGTTTLTNAGTLSTSDVVVGKYSTTGGELWAMQVGRHKEDYISGLALDNMGNVCVSGTFGDTVEFGTTTLISQGVGFEDIFVAKLGTAPTVAGMEYSSMQALIYPNPAKDELIISADVPVTDIAVVDGCGRNVFKGTYNAREVRVDTRGIAAGVYMLVINSTAVRRFVKE